MQLNRRFVIALILLALLLPGLSFRSFGGRGPQLLPNAQEAADRGALALTLYLTDALHLTQTQSWAVRACTRQELQQLAAAPEAGTSPDAVLLVQAPYDDAMAAILTPTQYRAFQQLERGPLVASTVSRVLAAR
jgi:hypothetical protein